MAQSLPIPSGDPRLEALVRAANPWWRGERIYGLPPLRRWAFGPVLQGVRGGLTPAVVLRGPRQVGKTTLVQQVIDRLLDDGVRPERILRLQFDELPELRRGESVLLELTRWFSEHVLEKSFNQRRRTASRRSSSSMSCRTSPIGRRSSSTSWT